MTMHSNTVKWTQIVVAVLIPVAAFFIAIVNLKSDVGHLEDEMETKVSRVEVEANQIAIMRELDFIREDIKDITRER